jgi:hypothetical protein
MTITDLDFVNFTDKENKSVFVNIRLIRWAILNEGGIDLWFSDTHKLHINGEDATREWVQRLTDRSMSLKGEPIATPAKTEPRKDQTPPKT